MSDIRGKFVPPLLPLSVLDVRRDEHATTSADVGAADVSDLDEQRRGWWPLVEVGTLEAATRRHPSNP